MKLFKKTTLFTFLLYAVSEEINLGCEPVDRKVTISKTIKFTLCNEKRPVYGSCGKNLSES